MAIPLKHGPLIDAEKKKIKVISVSKSDQRELWTLEKAQPFMPGLLQFLLDLGFSLEEDFDIKFYFGVPHEDDDYMPESYVKNPYSQKYISVNSFDQEVITFNRKNIDVEVIFFSNKIVLSIRTKKKSSEIGKLISKFALFGNEAE